MITDSTTGLHATHYKSIDGLQIRYAMNDKLRRLGQIRFSSQPAAGKHSSLSSLPGRFSPHSARSSPLIFPLRPLRSRPDIRTPETVGEFVLRIMDAFGLKQPHVVAPDIGTPACLFAAARHPGSLQESRDRQRRNRSH